MADCWRRLLRSMGRIVDELDHPDQEKLKDAFRRFDSVTREIKRLPHA